MKTAQNHINLFKEASKAFLKNKGFMQAGNMAFLGMISFFPFLIFLVAVSGFAGQTQFGQEAIIFILSNLPQEVSDAINGPIQDIIKKTGGEVLTFSILFALWTAATGVEAARAVILMAYGEEFRRPMWQQRLESLAVVIITTIIAITAMAILVLGPPIILAVNSFFEIPDTINDYLNLLRYLIGPFGLFLALYGLYAALSPRFHFNISFHAPGAILALIFWVTVATGFSTFLKYAGNFSVTYGGLAGVLVAQIFFFIVSIGFIMGAQLNSAYAHFNNENNNNESQDPITTADD